jgi:hypothetical protein
MNVGYDSWKQTPGRVGCLNPGTELGKEAE